MFIYLFTDGRICRHCNIEVSNNAFEHGRPMCSTCTCTITSVEVTRKESILLHMVTCFYYYISVYGRSIVCFVLGCRMNHSIGATSDTGADVALGCAIVGTADGVGIHLSSAAIAFSNSGEAPTSISAVISPVDGRIFERFPFDIVLVCRRESLLLKALLTVVLVAPTPAITNDFAKGISHNLLRTYNTHVDAETMISITGAPDAMRATL